MNDTAQLPVIDVGPSLSGDRTARFKTAREIWDALSRYGFFYVSNHGVPEELIHRTRRHFENFYAQPLEAKRVVTGHLMRGYTGFLEVGVGAAVEEGYRVNDLCERLTFGRELSEVERAADEYYQAPFAATMVPPNLWPADAASTGFKAAVGGYFRAMERLFEHLIVHLAIAADLTEDFWVPLFSKSSSALSGINYPEPPAELFKPGVARLVAHADLNVLTILQHENPVNGDAHLEVQIDGRWQGAPAKEGTLLVNIGEVMEKITHGRLRATQHRVVMPEQREGSRRLSLVFFSNPNHDAVFETLPCCVPPGERPQRFTYVDYITSYFSKVQGPAALTT